MDEFERQLGSAVAVGAVTPRTARIWARAPGAACADLTVELHTPSRFVARGSLDSATIARPPCEETDHTCAFTIPADVPELGALQPDRPYIVYVRRRDGALVGEGRFRTPWEGLGPSSGRLAFGLASCHQPFDGRGRVRVESARMLAAAERALRDHDARFLLLVGDQIYADYPPKLSLFHRAFFERVAPPGRHAPTDCSREEIRRLYQERHRIFLGVEPFARLASALPCYPMLDDHEVRDNFGTSPEHASKAWAELREGALDAFYDYQGSRVVPADGTARPPSFHYGFAYGPVAIFVADLRSQRVADDAAVHVFHAEQLASLARFLDAHAKHPVLCVVVTVPIVHIESWMAGVVAACNGRSSDAADRWSHPRMLADRDLFLRMLKDHQRANPEQRLVLLGGDIHVGSAFRLEWSDGGPPTYQLTASALSHLQGRATRWIAEKLPRATQKVAMHDGLTADVDLVAPANGAARNPYGGLNLGIVEVEWGERCGLRFKLVTAKAETDQPETVFESALL